MAAAATTARWRACVNRPPATKGRKDTRSKSSCQRELDRGKTDRHTQKKRENSTCFNFYLASAAAAVAGAAAAANQSRLFNNSTSQSSLSVCLGVCKLVFYLSSSFSTPPFLSSFIPLSIYTHTTELVVDM